MALFDLSPLGLLKVSGPDAKKLLQGQLTCNLDELSSHQSQLGAHCNREGRILSLFQLFDYQDDYFLLMPRALISAAQTALKKYAIFYQVTIEASEIFSLVGLIKEEAALLPLNAPSIKLAGAFERYLLLLKDPLSLTLAPFSAWKKHHLEQGLVDLHPETIGQFLPQELNLPLLNGISFNKGCYTGQEIIARIHYRGKLKTRAYKALVTLAALPIAGSSILDQENEPQGKLIDFCIEHKNQYQIIFLSKEKVAEPLFLNQHLLHLIG